MLAQKQQLFARTTRQVAPTRHGEDFLRLAKEVLRAVEELSSAIDRANLHGDISFGAPEDFTTYYLPGIIAAFAEANPQVRLHVTSELRLELLQRIRHGERDLVVIKADPNLRPAGAEPLWQEELVWAGRGRHEKPFGALCQELDRQGRSLPVVSAPPPCVYRSRATRALDIAGIAWSNVYVSPSFAGGLAAVRAGLGYMALPKAMLPGDLTEQSEAVGWPSLLPAEICLHQKGDISPQAKALPPTSET